MEEKLIPEIVSINQLCSLMEISRGRYYQILADGLIVEPIRSPDSKRPYFTREMALRNLHVKKNNVGVNGKICLFYNCNRSSAKNNADKKRKTGKVTNENTDLIDGLTSLGIGNVKPSQIDDAIKKCFPNGTDNVEEGEVLRQVFCLIKEQNSNDNVDR